MKLSALVVGTLCGLLSAPILAHEPAPPDDQLGEVQFPISCNAQAQVHFERGMALLRGGRAA